MMKSSNIFIYLFIFIIIIIIIWKTEENFNCPSTWCMKELTDPMWM